jgi:hypothetical protein|tara:strand:- start:4165 stop:4542 length:378 start_codon:yes stop_codon:yes gene_type:complete
MNANQLTDEFNNTSINLLDLIYSFNNDDSIIFYKTTINNLIKINNKKIIELFIIHCLEYKDKFENKDKNYFINMDLKKQITNKSLLEIINIKKLISNLDDIKINIIFEHFELLSYFSEEYLKTKL